MQVNGTFAKKTQCPGGGEGEGLTIVAVCKSEKQTWASTREHCTVIATFARHFPSNLPSPASLSVECQKRGGARGDSERQRGCVCMYVGGCEYVCARAVPNLPSEPCPKRCVGGWVLGVQFEGKGRLRRGRRRSDADCLRWCSFHPKTREVDASKNLIRCKFDKNVFKQKELKKAPPYKIRDLCQSYGGWRVPLFQI